MSTGRNAPCPCGSGRKYKVCCLHADDVARKRNTGEDALLVLVPTRGTICYETNLALNKNIEGICRGTMFAGRKPVVAARNALAKLALDAVQENPFPFVPREVYILWCDDDAWFQPEVVPTMLRCMREERSIDALFGFFGPRAPYSAPLAVRRLGDVESAPRVGGDCKYGDLVDIAEAGFHFVLMRASLLERVGPNPFDLLDGTGEDLSFCRRAKAIGARLVVGTGFPVGHIDPKDGAVYFPGQPAMRMDGNSVTSDSTEHLSPVTGALKKAEIRRYGADVDAVFSSRGLTT